MQSSFISPAGGGGGYYGGGNMGGGGANGLQQQQQQQQHEFGNGQGNGQHNNGQGPPNGSPVQPEYSLAGVLHYLQSEWRRYERDRNEWEIERAEMRARIALLEGERRGVDNLKTDLMRRVKMLEYALRQERSKYLASGSTIHGGAPNHAGGVQASKIASLQGAEKAASSSGRSSPSYRAESEAGAGQEPAHQRSFTSGTMNFSTLGGANGNTFGSTMNSSINSISGVPNAGLSRHGSSAKDPKARARSRDYLKQCLQEISYLTSTSVLNPLPERAFGTAGPQRPRKTMSDNVPFTFQVGAEGANNARRQKSIDAKTARGGLSASRPTQLANETLVEEASEEEAEASDGTKSLSHSDEDPLGASTSSPISLTADGSLRGPEGSRKGEEELFSEGESSSSSSGDDSSASATSGQTSPEGSNDIAAEHLDGEDDQERLTAVFRPGEGGRPDAEEWARLKEAGLRERERREREKRDAHGQLAATSNNVNALLEASEGRNTTRGAKSDEDELASLSMTSAEQDEDGSAKLAADSAAESQMWKSKRVLRSHLDAVRAVAFDTTGLCLFSASDDNTIKFWRLDPSTFSQPQPKTADNEPIMTLRGHSAAVTCLAVSSSRRRLYSGSVDSSIIVWKLPDQETEAYPPVDKHMEMATLVGHTQAIWDMTLLPLRSDDEALLATASADGTVKIWASPSEPSAESAMQLFLSLDYFGTDPSADKEKERETLLEQGNGRLPIPTSVAPCHSNLRLCAVSFTNAIVKLFDVDTGKEVMEIKANETYDGTVGTQINKLITHPTLPLLITAHEDHHIRMYDLDTGACTLSMVAHLDSVTCLDIDPSGLTLVSGGHDCSVRFWDIVNSTAPDQKRGHQRGEAEEEDATDKAAICVQEVTAHRRKAHEGVLAVKYHPTAPFFASAGADGVVRLYG